MPSWRAAAFDAHDPGPAEVTLLVPAITVGVGLGLEQGLLAPACWLELASAKPLEYAHVAPHFLRAWTDRLTQLAVRQLRDTLVVGRGDDDRPGPRCALALRASSFPRLSLMKDDAPSSLPWQLLEQLLRARMRLHLRHGTLFETKPPGTRGFRSLLLRGTGRREAYRALRRRLLGRGLVGLLAAGPERRQGERHRRCSDRNGAEQPHREPDRLPTRNPKKADPRWYGISSSCSDSSSTTTLRGAPVAPRLHNGAAWTHRRPGPFGPFR